MSKRKWAGFTAAIFAFGVSVGFSVGLLYQQHHLTLLTSEEKEFLFALDSTSDNLARLTWRDRGNTIELGKRTAEEFRKQKQETSTNSTEINGRIVARGVAFHYNLTDDDALSFVFAAVNSFAPELL
ncbi:DUF732 domain-containing protein [Nocardia goodfellowii]|uniref:Uncharacterized protein n=1 Tax=Nocardia goodfellowii TaxID=882446 RepID=A0ABS4QF36_9NOCA|nr:hypothetical protein [Nocardia goodfellowii]MBP2190183.1 hypothetical protein [Nocardia goodfellowii]